MGGVFAISSLTNGVRPMSYRLVIIILNDWFAVGLTM